MAKDSSKDSTTQPSKKLDRKAKHAKQSEKAQAADAQDDAITVEKEGGEDTHESPEKKKKKKRKSSDRTVDEDEDGKTEKKKEKKKRRHAEDEEEGNGADASKEEKPKKKKKRVSFGPGTKENDGDAEDVLDNDDAEDTTMSTATNGDGADADAEDNTDAAIEEMKKRKREKKKEKKKKNGGSSSTTTTASHLHETPILSYLSRYHADRASWKFQKNRETHLFKHLYSLEHVPVQYNAALLAYLQGLKGLSAKARLSYGAEEVIVADVDAEKKKDGDGQGEGEGEGSEGDDYQQAVEAFRTCLSEGKDDTSVGEAGKKLGADEQARLKKRQRAELVFFGVAGKLFTGEQSKPVSGKQAKAPGAAKKKRKNRTVIVEISSSSESEEDGDSDSTSSSGSSSS
ncbi:uncharacterized protein PFLUO_LOCUS6724 [Penicillium psychrofluorescens]|uniref:uncharacterized protein n=1 Tax=Penicillium psychrofluorescens TaxID=3158075 RepID=UPI003CCD1946